MSTVHMINNDSYQLTSGFTKRIDELDTRIHDNDEGIGRLKDIVDEHSKDITQQVEVMKDFHEELKATEDVVESLCENYTDLTDHIKEKDKITSKAFTGIFICQVIVIACQVVNFVIHFIGG